MNAQVSVLMVGVTPPQPSPHWLADARRALSARGLGLRADARVLTSRGVATVYMLEAVADGLTVCVRDTAGARYFVGSPAGAAPVLRWLISSRVSMPAANTNRNTKGVTSC